MNIAGCKALILTIGGSPKPLITSITHYQPEVVIFLASQDSDDKIPEIKDTVNAGVTCVSNYHRVLVNDINDITGCYQTALECSSYIEKKKIPAEDVIADITGGTKVMSSALTLLCISKGYRMTYTGGNLRDKNGVGQVLDGSEQVFHQANPWEVLAIEEQRKAVIMFNQFQFEAAGDILNSAKQKVRGAKIKRYMEVLIHITGAYKEWDKFHHNYAYSLLQKGCSEISVFADTTGDRDCETLAQQASQNLTFLKQFNDSSGSFKNICRPFILDLLANAGRRAIEGKYDDAIARLYCGLGLLGQLELKTAYNLEAGKIPVNNADVIKALVTLGPDFKTKYLEKNGTLKLPTYASFEFLAALGNETGEKYFQNQEAMHALLSARNESVLAHGIHPLEKTDYEKMWSIIINFSGISTVDLPVFPVLNTPIV